jgi:hypothetical protein
MEELADSLSTVDGWLAGVEVESVKVEVSVRNLGERVSPPSSICAFPGSGVPWFWKNLTAEMAALLRKEHDHHVRHAVAPGQNRKGQAALAVLVFRVLLSRRRAAIEK